MDHRKAVFRFSCSRFQEINDEHRALSEPTFARYLVELVQLEAERTCGCKLGLHAQFALFANVAFGASLIARAGLGGPPQFGRDVDFLLLRSLFGLLQPFAPTKRFGRQALQRDIDPNAPSGEQARGAERLGISGLSVEDEGERQDGNGTRAANGAGPLHGFRD